MLLSPSHHILPGGQRRVRRGAWVIHLRVVSQSVTFTAAPYGHDARLPCPPTAMPDCALMMLLQPVAELLDLLRTEEHHRRRGEVTETRMKSLLCLILVPVLGAILTLAPPR